MHHLFQADNLVGRDTLMNLRSTVLPLTCWREYLAFKSLLTVMESKPAYFRKENPCFSTVKSTIEGDWEIFPCITLKAGFSRKVMKHLYKDQHSSVYLDRAHQVSAWGCVVPAECMLCICELEMNTQRTCTVTQDRQKHCTPCRHRTVHFSILQVSLYSF